MKKQLNAYFPLFLIFFFSFTFSTTVFCVDYSFNGTGLYTDTSLWSPSYPGGVISADDTVTIEAGSECTVPVGTLLLIFGILTNNGELVSFNTWGCGFNGLLVNNGFILSHAIIDNLGGITNNGEFIAKSNFSSQGNGAILNNTSGTMSISTIFIATTINGGSYSFDGVFTGEGELIVDDYTNNGTIRPGFSPGVLTFNNDLILSSSGNIEIEINGNGGPGASNGHDQIIVETPGGADGDLSIDGTLDVSLTNGFIPQAGDEWVIATGVTSGSFSTTNLPSGYNWEVDIQSDQIVLRFLEGVLPVDLVHFGGHQVEEAVQLSWKTTAEINNENWSIQRMDASNEWKTIGAISGQGNSYTGHSYTFRDLYPLTGTNYYRLIQVDFDGSRTLSEVITIDFNLKAKEIQIFPNPSVGIIHFSNQLDEIKVFDLAGRLLFSKKHPEQTLDLGFLQDGQYNLLMINDDVFLNKTILIHHQ